MSDASEVLVGRRQRKRPLPRLMYRW